MSHNDFAPVLPNYYFIDLFCGAGGTTTGIEEIGTVIACINHDKNAIASHAANHPNALHFVEDIRTVALEPIIRMVIDIRLRDPRAVICLWASLECTNHSNAKGGMSRDADSRTLAEHLFRYVQALNPDMVWIENVQEFKNWCRLRIKAKTHENYSELIMTKPTKKKPIPEYVMVPDMRYKGEHYDRWVKNMKTYGFNFDDTIQNAADYGCETSRKRLFIQFAKPHIKISWAAPTHHKNALGGLEKWKPVRPLLDLQDQGRSIFEKDKPWAEPSLWRKYRGLVKFVHEPFFVKYYGNGNNICSIEDPCPTLTRKDRMYYVCSEYGKSIGSSIEQPCPSILKNPKESLVTVNFLKLDYTSGPSARSLEVPAPSFLAKRQKESFMSVNFLYDHQFKNTGSSVDKPCPTLIARQDKKPLNLASVNFLVDHQFNNTGRSLDGPCPTLTASRHQQYLLTADGRPAHMQWIFDKVEKDYKDSKAMAAIVQFMIDHGISDIKVRPLRIKEMLDITGFPNGYKLIGNQTEQKKFIGNAVPCKWVKSMISHSIQVNKIAA